MTTDKAITLIPRGWLLRLTHWQDRDITGWAAELHHHANGGCIVQEADTPAEAVRLAGEEARLVSKHAIEG